MTLLDEIAAAAVDVKPFTHPRFIDGQLLLTSDEYDAMIEQYGPPKYPTSTAQRLSSIPVTVVPVDGTPKNLGGNKVAVYSKITSSIYIFNHLETIDAYSSWSHK